MSDDSDPKRRRRSRRHPRRPARSSSRSSRSSWGALVFLTGVVLGVGPGMYAAFELPVSYFRAEWTQVQAAAPLVVPAALAPETRGPAVATAVPVPTSRYAERAWQVIETLETQAPETPAP